MKCVAHETRHGMYFLDQDDDLSHRYIGRLFPVSQSWS